MSPFSHSPMLAASMASAGAGDKRPLMIRLKAMWEDSVNDRKIKVCFPLLCVCVRVCVYMLCSH